MQYQVKVLATFRGNEGQGFNGYLYRDGVKVASVLDDASGGPIRIDWLDGLVVGNRVNISTHNYEDKPYTYLGSPEEKMFIEYVDGLTYFCEHAKADQRHSSETYIGKLVDSALEEKDLRRWCRKSLVFRLPGDKKGQFHKMSQPYSPDTKAWVLGKHPDAEILNERFSS
jgi:hypothetical protein